jgi:hypothetical protein
VLIRFAFVVAFNAQEVGGDSSMPDKLRSISAVVQSIASGSHIALGGFSIARYSSRISLAESERKSYNAFSDCRGTAPVCGKKCLDRYACEVRDTALSV